MRYLLFKVLPLVILGSITSYAIGIHPLAPKYAKNDDDIKFYTGTYREALIEAKKENKLIFLDIYATWCGPCKMLKRNSFPNKGVGTHFNNNFINLSIDGETPEGTVLAEQYRIRGYPSLFILDNSGNVLTQTAGYLPPDELLRFAKSIQ